MSELMHRLIMPFAPTETRLRLKQQQLDIEAARKAPGLLSLDGVEVSVVDRVVGRGSWREVELKPIPSRYRPTGWWFTWGRFSWNGSRLTAVGGDGRAVAWQTQAGGVKPGFGAEEVAQVGRRPVTSGECPAHVAELAAVILPRYWREPRRLYLLDDESRHLGAFPASGLTQEGLARLANAAAVVLRTYEVRTGGRVWPDELCGEALFPPSARRQRSVNGWRDERTWRY